MFHQARGVDSVLGTGSDANTHGHIQLVSVDQMGCAQALNDLLRTDGRILRLRDCVKTTTNSSPPIRPAVSEVRTHPRSRAATDCSSRSPISWPSESLMYLKRSTSMNKTA